MIVIVKDELIHAIPYNDKTFKELDKSISSSDMKNFLSVYRLPYEGVTARNMIDFVEFTVGCAWKFWQFEFNIDKWNDLEEIEEETPLELFEDKTKPFVWPKPVEEEEEVQGPYLAVQIHSKNEEIQPTLSLIPATKEAYRELLKVEKSVRNDHTTTMKMMMFQMPDKNVLGKYAQFAEVLLGCPIQVWRRPLDCDFWRTAGMDTSFRDLIDKYPLLHFQKRAETEEELLIEDFEQLLLENL